MQPHERTIRKESQHVLPPFSDDLAFEESLSNNNNINNNNIVNHPPSNNNNNMLNSRTLSNPRSVQHSTMTSHSSSSSSLNNSRNKLIEKNNSMMINNSSAPSSSSSSSTATTLIPIGGVGSGIAIIPGNQVLSTTQSNNNHPHSLPEKIVGGASKCPICTRNKQSCEESKELSGKIGVSNPFLKSENDSFNNRIVRNKGKIKMKEFNSSTRAEFKNFMKKISSLSSSEMFKSEEEYSAFLKKNYYDVLNQMLNNIIKNSHIDDDEEYQSDPSDDEEEPTTEEDDDSDSDTADDDTDEDDSIQKKRKTKLSTPSSKKSKLDKSPAATSKSNGSSSSPVPSSSSSSSNIVPLAEAKVELVAYQEKYKSLNIHMLCILNLSDFDSLEKFKAKIKKELNITKDDFKVYFQLEKLQGREFIVGNASGLKNLKQQVIGCPATKRQIIEIRGM